MTAVEMLEPVAAQARGGAGNHPFLSGVHAPMTDELTLSDLRVTGEIPAALSGRYLRIGPNPAASPDPVGYHWFTGDGMVHGVALQDGRALWYKNRWIRSKAVGAARGVDPAPGPRSGPTDTVNTNIVAFGDRTFALIEAGGWPVELDATLETQAYNPFDGTLTGAFSAHPHLDPATGEQHAITYAAGCMNQVHHVVIDGSGRVVREEPVTVAHGPSIHDCAITQRYALIFDLPVTFSMASAMAGMKFPYRWNADHPARVGLLPRNGSEADLVWCVVEPAAYVFHVANAFDAEDGRVVVDLVAYDSMFSDGMQGGPDAVGRLERWTLDPATGRTDRRVLDAAPQEFPRCDERRFGRPYRYAYAMASAEDFDPQWPSAPRLYKHDLHTGARRTHDFGPGRLPGEFVFVPARADAAEDEGWLIGFVINAEQDTTNLVILDAQRFENAPVARVHLPHRVPPGFHGNWIPA